VGTDEREADLEGIRILRAQKQHIAARLLKNRLVRDI
jgi:hypothetical protein